jgi:hypothetical protein
MSLIRLLSFSAAILAVCSAYSASVSLPGTVPADQYSSYYDNDTVSNNAKAGPDTSSAAGVAFVGWINANEWLEYDVSVGALKDESECSLCHHPQLLTQQTTTI